jgi:Cd2+/Zn2+-exporting ATPase
MVSIPLSGLVRIVSEWILVLVVMGYLPFSGYMSVRTTALAEDCVVAKMAKLVEEAQNSKSKTQRFIDKFAQYYTPG